MYYLVSAKSVEHIVKFHCHLKDIPVEPCLSTIAANQSDDNRLCLLTLRSISPVVLMHVWALFLKGFRRNRNYLIVVIVAIIIIIIWFILR